MLTRSKEDWNRMHPQQRKDYTRTFRHPDGDIIIFEENEEKAYEEAVSQFTRLGDRSEMNWDVIFALCKNIPAPKEQVEEEKPLDDELVESLDKLEKGERTFNLQDTKRVLRYLLDKTK